MLRATREMPAPSTADRQVEAHGRVRFAADDHATGPAWPAPAESFASAWAEAAWHPSAPVARHAPCTARLPSHPASSWLLHRASWPLLMRKRRGRFGRPRRPLVRSVTPGRLPRPAPGLAAADKHDAAADTRCDSRIG